MKLMMQMRLKNFQKVFFKVMQVQGIYKNYKKRMMRY